MSGKDQTRPPLPTIGSAVKSPPSTDIPRRRRLDLNTPAELAIRHAMLAVERAGAHPLLTEAINFLGLAREAVADFVDRPGASPPPDERASR